MQELMIEYTGHTTFDVAISRTLVVYTRGKDMMICSVAK